MVAILSTIQLIELSIIFILAGIVAIAFGALNIKDFFYFKKGPTASIPEGKKPKIYKQMRKVVKISSIPSLIAATIILAISVNNVELLCSFNLPLIYTSIILSYDLSFIEYYTFILFYNIVYVIPLILIVSGLIITLGRWKLSEFQGRVLKLFSGLMLFFLGETLLIYPTILEDVFIALFILLICVVSTFIISFIWKIGEKSQTT